MGLVAGRCGARPPNIPDIHGSPQRTANDELFVRQLAATQTVVQRPSRSPAGTRIKLEAELAAPLPALLRFAQPQLRHDSLAEDVVSETLLAILEKLAAFKGRSSLRSHAKGILEFKVIDVLRKRGCAVHIETMDEQSQDDRVEALFAKNGLYRDARPAWHSSPKKRWNRRSSLKRCKPASTACLRMRAACSCCANGWAAKRETSSVNGHYQQPLRRDAVPRPHAIASMPGPGLVSVRTMKVNPVCQEVSGLRSGRQDETPPAAHRARLRLRSVMRSNSRNVDEQMALLRRAARGAG